MSDQELQLALVKLLPEQLIIIKSKPRSFIAWFYRPKLCVNNTEWFHVCHLIELKLSHNDWMQFAAILENISINDAPTKDWRVESASWQQRATALLKLKGLT